MNIFETIRGLPVWASVLLAVTVSFVLLALVNYSIALFVERRRPPTGRFIEGNGVRLRHGSGREQAEPTVWQPLDTRCDHDGRWRQGQPTQTGRQAERRDPGWHAADPARDWAHDSSRRHAAGGRRYRRSRSKICRERVAPGRGLWFGPQTRELTPRVLGCGVEQGRPAAWLTMSAFGNCEIGLGDRHGPIVLKKLKLPPWQNCREGPPHIAFGWE